MHLPLDDTRNDPLLTQIPDRVNVLDYGLHRDSGNPNERESSSKSTFHGHLLTLWMGVGSFFAAMVLALALWLPLDGQVSDDENNWFKKFAFFVRNDSETAPTQLWAAQAEQLKDKTATLSKGQQNLVAFLAKKYRTANSEVRKMVAAAYIAGGYTKQDPLLILAVMSIESNLNPLVESAAGAQGLMQIMPKVHAARFAQYGGVENIFNIDTNVLIGARILQDCIKIGDNTLEGGLKCYVGASGPSDGGYGAKVLLERDRFVRVSKGDMDATQPKVDLELKPSIELLPHLSVDKTSEHTLSNASKP